MPRFIPTRSGAGIPAIQDTAKKRIVATFFIDKDAPDAAETCSKCAVTLLMPWPRRLPRRRLRGNGAENDTPG